MRRLIFEEPYSRSATGSRRLAAFSLCMAALAAVLGHVARWDPYIPLILFLTALALGAGALTLALVSAVSIWRTGRRGVGRIFTALFLLAILCAYPAYLGYQAFSLHARGDISTDSSDPPSFRRSHAAITGRGGWIPAEAGGDGQTRQSADLQPIVVDLEADETFRLALETAQALHWKILEAVPPGPRLGLGHIDALDHSLALNLPEAVAIRIRPLAGQTRVDLRSVSRYFPIDFGSNTGRIDKFSDALQERIDAR